NRAFLLLINFNPKTKGICKHIEKHFRAFLNTPDDEHAVCHTGLKVNLQRQWMHTFKDGCTLVEIVFLRNGKNSTNTVESWQSPFEFGLFGFPQCKRLNWYLLEEAIDHLFKILIFV